MFTFGRKSVENEFEFPGFSAQTTRSWSAEAHLVESTGKFSQIASNPKWTFGSEMIAELAYVIRRVELNGRVMQEGQSPWSIRQTAVYHQYKRRTSPSNEPSADSTSVFLLISPSNSLDKQIIQSCGTNRPEGRGSSMSSLHGLLVSDALKAWMDYMAWLEVQMKEQVRRGTYYSMYKPSLMNVKQITDNWG